MATEKRLIPDGEKVTLDELYPGTIFAFGDDCIAVKSEYRCSNGLIEAFIIDSGEQFWGGAKTAKEQNELMVQPLTIEEVDAVEVVRCKEQSKFRVLAVTRPPRRSSAGGDVSPLRKYAMNCTENMISYVTGKPFTTISGPSTGFILWRRLLE